METGQIGIAIVAVLVLNKLDPYMGINAGFLTLCVNFVVTVAVSLRTRPASGFVEAMDATASAKGYAS